MVSLSETLSSGDHEHWFYGFARGALLTMWIDQKLRARWPERGLLEAMLDLDREWHEHPVGIPEADFERRFAAHLGFSVAEIFAECVRGEVALPLEEILAGAGIRIEGERLRVMADEELSADVLRFRRAAFE